MTAGVVGLDFGFNCPANNAMQAASHFVPRLEEPPKFSGGMTTALNGYFLYDFIAEQLPYRSDIEVDTAEVEREAEREGW